MCRDPGRAFVVQGVRGPDRRIDMTILLMTLLVGCEKKTDPVYPSEVTQLELERDDIEAEIIEMIGDASCTEEAACASVPMGEKACGGPEFHLVYCAETVDVSALEALAAEHSDLQDQINILTGAESTCDVVEPPEVILEDGACIAE